MTSWTDLSTAKDWNMITVTTAWIVSDMSESWNADTIKEEA